MERSWIERCVGSSIISLCRGRVRSVDEPRAKYVGAQRNGFGKRHLTLPLQSCEYFVLALLSRLDEFVPDSAVAQSAMRTIAPS